MSRTQPIRKPEKLRYELNKHRRLSRAINSRIFQSAGKLYLVSHAPVLSALEEPLASLKLESFVNGDHGRCEDCFCRHVR